MDLKAATRAYTYTPADDFAGSDAFTIEVSDGQGGTARATGDADGDGRDELLARELGLSGPTLYLADGMTGLVTRRMQVANVFSQGGLRVGAIECDGDGLAEFVGGAGTGTGPYLVALEGEELAPLDSIFAFDQEFQGGIYLAGSK